jgi:hypothetical protein
MKRVRPSDIIEVLLGEVDRGFADRLMTIWMTMREERALGSRYEPDEIVDFALAMWDSVGTEFTTWLTKDARKTYGMSHQCWFVRAASLND